MDSTLARIKHIYYVKEIYNRGKCFELFQRDLERAIEIGYSIIVIEPHQIGQYTAIWIRNGNYFLRCTVAVSVSCLIADLCKIWNLYVVVPLYTLSLIANSVYVFVWYLDPCIDYEKYTDLKILSHFDIKVNQDGPTVIIRGNLFKKKCLLSCSLLILTYYSWKIFRMFK